MNPKHVISEFDKARDWLLPALQGDDTEDDLLNDLFLRRAQLWRGDNAAMVTRLVSAEEPYIMVWLGGGELDGLLDLQPGVEAWARAQGAKAARINGRKGWMRALKDRGFVPSDGELKKAL